MSRLSTSLPDHLPIHTIDPNLDFGTKSFKSAKSKGLSLRLKATLLATAIGTLPLLGIGVVGYLVFSRLDRAKTEESEQRLATEIKIQLTQLMAERASDVQIVAELDILIDSDLRQTTTQTQKTQALDRFVKIYPIYDSVAAFDLNGDVIAQSQGEPLGNHRNRSYIQAALRAQGPILSQPMTSISSGVLSVYAAAPIKDKATGKIIGTVRMRVPVENLTKLSVLLDGKSGTDYYLLDRDGNVFYSSLKQATKPESSQAPAADPATTAADLKAIETIFPAIAQLRANQQADSLVAENQVTQARQLVSYVPPQRSASLAELNWNLPELNWSVVVATDTAVAFQAQRNQLLILLLGAGGSAMLASAVAIYLVNRVIRPILNAAEAVEKIGQGELNTRVQVQGDDEVAILGTNINRMADQIQEFDLDLLDLKLGSFVERLDWLCR
ncbi:sensor histidine kinase [Leptolyngbya sp. 7M]|uniref:cache domain-containing sensor histidine kinase n=1 Tax=Leptolyngbya sp. 7M TaxID=2812896 RepID=UPI001B8CB0BC|nr:cache domain-containing protein [Leptolyngbya sp. 7M]QYO62214.1 HAMP domain-containing protein [Leptolyngbya sp. 7M]